MTGISAFGKQRAGRGTARRWRHRWAALALAVITLIFLVPFFWVLSQSLEPSAEFSRNLPTLWPSHPTLGNYYTVLIRDSFSRSILSSFIVAAITTVITLVLGGLAGYALSRLPIRGRGLVLGFVILAGFFPLTAMMGPLFEVMSHIGLLNTYLGLSIADLIYTVPLTTWLLASLFGQIPMEIEEAALVDGASRLGAVWRIIVPLAAPALVTAAIFSFLLVWNDFAFSLAFLQTANRFTAPLSIVMLSQTKYQVFYNLTDAGVLLTALPIFVLVLFAQRRIVSGLTTGALR
ncbi:MAG: carbohydrate ABC transporter permease [Streptosporangiaceae bacterium]|jgi:ABC-type glycerol-3-phosphate transport system permease component